MFLVFPYSNKVSFSKIPVISYFIVFVCLLVFYFQYQSNRDFKADASSFCQLLQQQKTADELDKMQSDNYLCQLMIRRIDERPDLTIRQILDEYFWFQDYTNPQITIMSGFIEQHYAKFSHLYSGQIDKELMYFPDAPELLKMLTSAVAHADILHISGNLIFFMAFAPAVEIVLASSWLYITCSLLIIVFTSLAYSASVLITGDALPALGLSGLVMGMMGLFAALMPQQKINVFVWLLLLVRSISVPAWILMLWYIGIDSLSLLSDSADGSINLVAHISGGIGGYALGYALLKSGLVKTASG
ncbi:MAG: rhomboid family intramembrane serine protease [Gammaproteobacteria bacterium]|nr:rhomboid family intramembrane serine protease [Gammaproteobacteria bacterium]